MNNAEYVYQRIGEFAVAFQSIENTLREIGWFVIDPERLKWPPPDLRNLTNEKLVDRVYELFLQAMPKCKLPKELEADLKESFASAAKHLHQLRRDRNQILHSAFVELKSGGEAHWILRTSSRLQVDEETGEPLFDQELLTAESFADEMEAMAELSMFLNRAYTQLIHRYPNGGA
ncbi:hypothetical protein [Pseudomonas aeruginosa]|uniref:hypothetical protein n=1 Tax=Pseudomonas aeruginosa TaxID=287 RepID=UPI0003BB2FB1|nr:hypothetical protein [Pseudomonas aeruginosa]ERZ01104.1 hypothetical protein Q022_02246 [Pseudomonas aeruginosa BWHPSA009]MCO1948134.1 hypothetical protein [Pseudomonas aeruginosa]